MDDALLEDAALQLCGVKILVLIPACCNVFLIHREIVSLDAALCGLPCVTISSFTSAVTSLFLRFKYTSRQLKMHSFLLV